MTREDDADASIFSDMYKDAWGFRPWGSTVALFLARDQEGRKAWLDELDDEIAWQMVDENHYQEEKDYYYDRE